MKGPIEPDRENCPCCGCPTITASPQAADAGTMCVNSDNFIVDFAPPQLTWRCRRCNYQWLHSPKQEPAVTPPKSIPARMSALLTDLADVLEKHGAGLTYMNDGDGVWAVLFDGKGNEEKMARIGFMLEGGMSEVRRMAEMFKNKEVPA